MYLVFTSDRMNAARDHRLCRPLRRRPAKNLTGVADVQIFGERRYAMRIWIDRERLAAFGLTAQDVEDALRAQNVELPAGRIESSDREFTVLSRTRLVTPEQFGNIVVKTSTASGEARRRRSRRTWRRRRAARSAATMASRLSPSASSSRRSPIRSMSHAVRGVMPEIDESLPQGLSAEHRQRQHAVHRRSIKSVYQTILEAIVLVVLVIFFFLRSLRASIIPIVTIPISLIATFALMYALGFSINTLTLLAMVLAIGLVVDDAIVVLENIFRHIEGGMRPFGGASRARAKSALPSSP